jgi:CHAT domain-containing protein
MSTYQRSLDLISRTFGDQHPQYGLVMSLVARLYIDMGQQSRGMDAALLAEEIDREHRHLTVRVLHEEAALAYAATRNAGLDLAVSLAVGNTPVSDTGRVFDALLRSRALVLDDMAARRRRLDASDEVVQDWMSASERVANLYVKGPGDMELETFEALLAGAQRDKAAAEEALARASVEFSRESDRLRLGLADVRQALPTGSALLAYTRFNRYLGRDESGKPSWEPSYAAFVVIGGDDETRTAVLLGPAARVDQLVADWRRAVTAGIDQDTPVRANARATYQRAGDSLRRAVWDPVAPQLSTARQVFVVPDSSLNLVTLAALPTTEGRFLLDDGPVIHYLSSEKDLALTARPPSGSPSLLLVGDPAFDSPELFAALAGTDASPQERSESADTGPQQVVIASTATTALLEKDQARPVYRGLRSSCGDFQSLHFERLPGAAEEARQIAALWKRWVRSDASSDNAKRRDLNLLNGAMASETTVKQDAATRRVLHLSTHGFFLGEGCENALTGARGIGSLSDSSDTPHIGAGHPAPPAGENPLLFSGLALAGANHREAAGPDEDDGILTAEEIAALDLSGVEWAVLSACDTGVGEVRAGEGVFGLRRAFQVAGARTLIMSLWSVDDEATREWMTALYEGRLNEGMTTAEAVHHASLSTLNARRERGESTHPFYWAAFVAAGDWR